ncbi:transposase, partial [Candidatus Woesebacteria bacterium]|nr:transposase [Candidatus Woesebacteria bacterium]
MTPTRNRKNIRLHKFDYSSSGFYFITICTQNRIPYFGNINDGQLEHNLLGTIAGQCLNEIPNHFKEARIDESIIMPNHVHAIIHLSNVGDAYMHPLSTVVQNYKASVTRKIKGERIHPEFSWQRSYYD